MTLYCWPRVSSSLTPCSSSFLMTPNLAASNCHQERTGPQHTQVTEGRAVAWFCLLLSLDNISLSKSLFWSIWFAVHMLTKSTSHTHFFCHIRESFCQSSFWVFLWDMTVTLLFLCSWWAVSWLHLVINSPQISGCFLNEIAITLNTIYISILSSSALHVSLMTWCLVITAAISFLQ